MLGVTPLYTAARNGHVPTVKLLLAEGANPNKAETAYGTTSLMNAVENGHEQTVKLLLAAGANPNNENNNGDTSLLWAAEKGYERIMMLLLNSIYNIIADKVLIAVSQQDIIFDTAFIIFKKTVEKSITVEGFNIDDTDTHKKLYSIFQSKFFKSVKKLKLKFF